jgi:hypothetical protein
LWIVAAGAVLFAEFATQCLLVIESDGSEGRSQRPAGLVMRGGCQGVSAGCTAETDSGAELAIVTGESWGGVREFHTSTGDSVAIGVIDLNGERLIRHGADAANYGVFGYVHNGRAEGCR